MAGQIDSVAVLGAGTMGSGIAALCAEAGCRSYCSTSPARRGHRPWHGWPKAARQCSAIPRQQGGSHRQPRRGPRRGCRPRLDLRSGDRGSCDQAQAVRGPRAAAPRGFGGQQQHLRIPLRALADGLPAELRRDLAVTHFFNPVKVMKLVELVPGETTAAEVLQTLESFLDERLGKGVVHAKDTVNFIANRIGCFWMLAGLHKAKAALAAGLSMEQIDALMGSPVGIPPTGLYGLIDLIGLDVMALVGGNLAANLPPDDAGRAYTSLPPAEQAMLARGQLGRKSGGGFYRLVKAADGGRSKETFDLASERWRPTRSVELADQHADAGALLFADDAAGRFAWDLLGRALGYAADLVPEIADDIVDVDRAMRWGFNWRQGPFELLDALGPSRVALRLESEGQPLPNMLQVLRRAGAECFYRAGGQQQLGADGAFHPVR